jgi:tripartite-type tricarboxylate transporter receptor subunit TctC
VLFRSVPYDPVRDFTPIITIVEGIEVLVANASLPVKSVKELIAYSKANPGKLFYGSSGVGGAQHIDGQNFNRLAGTNITAVQYVSFAQIVPAVVSGQVALAYITLMPIRPFLASGKLKLIAVAESKRLEALPDIETIAESLPGYEKAVGWTALLGPAKLPQRIVERLYSAAMGAINAPEIRAKVLESSDRIVVTAPDQFAARLKEQVEKTARMVKELGINVSE